MANGCLKMLILLYFPPQNVLKSLTVTLEVYQLALFNVVVVVEGKHIENNNAAQLSVLSQIKIRVLSGYVDQVAVGAFFQIV